MCDCKQGWYKIPVDGGADQLVAVENGEYIAALEQALIDQSADSFAPSRVLESLVELKRVART